MVTAPLMALADPLDAKTQDMLDQLDKLDRMDFVEQLERADRCTVERNFKCTEDSLAKARRFASTDRDRVLMARAKDAMDREIARARQEQQDREAQQEEERQAQRREERREQCIEKCPIPGELQACLRGNKHPDRCDDGEPPPPSTAQIVLGSFNKTMEGHKNLTKIHNEGMQNIAALQAQRQLQAQVIIDNENAQRRQREADAKETRDENRRRQQARERENERARLDEARQRTREREAELAKPSAGGYRPGTVIVPVDPPRLVVNTVPAPCVLGAASERNLDRNQLGSGCLNNAGAPKPATPPAPTRLAAATGELTFSNPPSRGTTSASPSASPSGETPAAPAAAAKVKWGARVEEMLAICRQSSNTGRWQCYGALDNQIIVDEPSLASALARQHCPNGTWAAGGPEIKGQQWQAYKCGIGLGAGDYDVGKRYNLITARRQYICPAYQGRRCDNPYDGQDLRD